MKRRGFTLIELLVVIAIIAILAAILFPVFAKAREKARQAACLSNAVQISRAFMMYCDDYDETAPPLIDEPAYTQTWMQALYPYIKNVQVFGCPSGIFKPTGVQDIDVPHGCGVCTYGWNLSVFNYPRVFPTRLGDLDTPAETAFMCDSNGGNAITLPGGIWWNYTGYGSLPYGSGPLIPGVMRPANTRHNGVVNVSFADGHAKAVAYNELVKTVPNTEGRRVTYVADSTGWPYVMGWTNDKTINIFPYFCTSAQTPHF